ncbi:hypothetical protein R4467_02140 [Acinetobacter baumannii]|nr:hypothetical protein [Acinetobacter baumannii]
MDKKALQEQFEAIAIQNCWNINKYPAGWDGHGDDEYVDDFVSGAWWGFQEQQAKVEELQKRVDKALELMQKPVIVGEPAKYVCARFKEIEQALKGGGL